MGRGLTLIPPPSSSEPELPLGSSWLRSWDRLRVRQSHHRLRQKPQPEAAAVLLRHPGIRPVRGHGPVLFDDGLPPAVRILRRFYVVLRHLAIRGDVLSARLSVLCPSL